MIWNLYGARTSDTSTHLEAQLANQKSQRAEEGTRTLEQQMNHLTLACQAMWELVRDKTDLTEEDLHQKISEIDLRDGRQDGKIGHSVFNCSGCGRKVSSRSSRCIMCGADVEKPHQFEV